MFRKSERKKTKEKRAACTLSRLSGHSPAFDTFFHIYIASFFFYFVIYCVGFFFFPLFFFVRLGLIGFAGGRRSFRIRGFHLLSGGLLSSAYAGRWGPGTGFRGLMIFHLGCKPIKGFLMLPATGIGFYFYYCHLNFFCHLLESHLSCI